jgi:hypothetical protein
MKWIYPGFLIHPNFACRQRVDRLSKGLSRSHSSTKPQLCLSFSSSKSNRYGVSVRSLRDVVRELDGCKGSPDIHFNHGLFEVVIDLDEERGSWQSFIRVLETRIMLFITPNIMTSRT